MTINRFFSATGFITLMGCMAMVLSSCLRDKNDDCPHDNSRVRIVVRTITEQTRSDSDIENVNIYIFDEHERFAGSWSGDAYTYGEVYEAWLDIDPGIYQFVVWTNLGVVYAGGTQGESVGGMSIGIDYPSDGKITDDLPELHHGMLTGAEVAQGNDNEHTIVISPNTYRLNFTVEGLPADSDDYIFKVTDNNSHYTFDNTIIEGQPEFDYIRSARFSGGVLFVSMNTLRLVDYRSPLFDFSNDTRHESLFNAGLVDIIKKAYNSAGRTVDFDREFEYDIKLTFHGSLGVTITVNGWSYYSNDTHLS